MPKVADPDVRIALIETAAHLIATEGAGALTLRRLADEVGTSTMAVYTHFGGMNELRQEVRREGFARLATHLDAVDDTGDTVADLLLLGWAYYLNATTNPDLYRIMFMEQVLDEEDAEVGLETFERLVRAVQRCIDAGRFDAAPAVDLATELWTVTHGVSTLTLAGMLSDDQAVKTCADAGLHLVRAFGDDPAAAGRSMSRAVERAASEGTAPPSVIASR